MISYDEVLAELQDALSRVEQNADPSWKEEAYLALFKTACEKPEFISDDVWEIGKLSETRENRALGPVFMRARRAGICEKTDRVRPSLRSHLSGKPIWKSLIYNTVNGHSAT